MFDLVHFLFMSSSGCLFIGIECNCFLLDFSYSYGYRLSTPSYTRILRVIYLQKKRQNKW